MRHLIPAVLLALAAPLTTGCATLQAAKPELVDCGKAALQQATTEAAADVQQILSEQSPTWSQDLDALLAITGDAAVCAVTAVADQLEQQASMPVSATARAASFAPTVPLAVKLYRVRSYRQSRPERFTPTASSPTSMLLAAPPRVVLGAAFAPVFAAAVSSSIISAALGFGLDHLGTLLGAILSIGAVGTFLTAQRKRRIALATYHAFHIVEDIDAETGGTMGAVQKVDQGLKALDAYMLAQGWRPAKEGEQQVAKLTFTSMNAQANAAKAIGTVSNPAVPTSAPAA